MTHWCGGMGWQKIKKVLKKETMTDQAHLYRLVAEEANSAVKMIH